MGAVIESIRGGLIFIDGEGVVPCSCCGYVADYACDYVVGKGKTCDRPLCGEHAIRQSGDGVDFCPGHHAACHPPDAPAVPRLAHEEERRIREAEHADYLDRLRRTKHRQFRVVGD